MFIVEEKILFLKKILGRYYNGSRKEEIVFHCPFCQHRKLKLQINVKTDLYHCWVCGAKGNNLSKIIRKIGTKEDLNLYNSLYKSANVKIEQKEEKKEFLRIGLPENYYPLSVSKSFVADKLKKYLIFERDLNENDILKWKIGVASVEDRFDNGIIFPSFDKYGLVNYYTARTINPKRYYLPKSDCGYKSSIIINELNVDFSKPILIVEGFMDGIKSRFENVVPLLGSSLSKNSKLFNTIIENKTVVFLGLDSDAILKKCDIAKDFLAHNIECYDIDVAPFHDIGEMKKEDFKVRYENAKKFDENYMLKIRMSSLV